MQPRDQSSTIADILETAASSIKWVIAVFQQDLVGIEGTGKLYGHDLLRAVGEERPLVGQGKSSKKFFIIDNCGSIYEVSVKEILIGGGGDQ